MNPVRRNIGRSSKKKMQGPKKFVKTTSKRLSRQKPSAKKPTKHTKETILKSIRDNKKVSTKKLTPKTKKITLVSTLQNGLVRLEKYMAQSGMASRREAKDLINRGLVTINGKTIREPGYGITVGADILEIKKQGLAPKETLLFYKPRGIETSKTSPEAVDIHDKFPQFKHLAPVGRLDKDSEGLILLSNDGVLAKMITGEDSTIDKEYLVTVREDVMPAVLAKMERGILIEGELTKPCIAEKVSRNQYTIILHEGKKHQVRRMANACKMTITRLVRIRIGDLTVGKMIAGHFKKIPNDVIEQMKKQ